MDNSNRAGRLGSGYGLEGYRHGSRRRILGPRKIETGFEYRLEFDALDRTVTRFAQTDRRLTKLEANIILKRIARAQTRAAALRRKRLPTRRDGAPMPDAVAQLAIGEVFGNGKLNEPEWLARVTAACGDAYALGVLKDWIDQRRLNLVAQYISEQKRVADCGEGTASKLRNLFLFSHWHVLGKQGMTSVSAHQLATDIIGPNHAGTLAAFQKHCTRHGIRFHEPRPPKTSRTK